MHSRIPFVRTQVIVATFAFALCLLGQQANAWTGEEPQSDGFGTLSIMSYNIRYLNTRDGEDVWPNRREAVVKSLKSADVVGLQEVVAKQLEYIKKSMPEYVWYGVGRDDGKNGGEMTAIGWNASKVEVGNKGTFWLSPTPNKVASKAWDAALPRIASWVDVTLKSNGRQALVVNTHFDHRGAVARFESAKLLRKWVSEHRGKRAAVLMGDFNAEHGTEPIDAIVTGGKKASLLRDAREISAKSDTGPNSTWNGFREIIPGRRIDHIFVAGTVEILEFLTLDPRTGSDRFASDHLPVRASVVIGSD